MATVIEVNQGGTGEQTVSGIKKKLGLGTAADSNISNDYTNVGMDTVPSSYALTEALRNVKGGSLPDIIEINRGGTGASTANDALNNLLTNQPLPLSKGGTGAKTAEEAFRKITGADILPVSKGGTGSNTIDGAFKAIVGSDVLPIEKGGTGAKTAEEAVKNLGIGETTIQYPIPVEKGGTGGKTAQEARGNLGLFLPLSLQNGGTGGKSADDAFKNIVGYEMVPVSKGGTGANSWREALSNLGLTLPVPISKGGTESESIDEFKEKFKINYLTPNTIKNEVDLNEFIFSGIYISDPDIISSTDLNYPAAEIKHCTMLVLSGITSYAHNYGLVTQILFDIDTNSIYFRSVNKVIIGAIEPTEPDNPEEIPTDPEDQPSYEVAGTWSQWVELTTTETDKNVNTHEWIFETEEDQKVFQPTEGEPEFIDPSRGLYFVFLESSKLCPRDYSISAADNTITLNDDVNLSAGQRISVSYIGK